MSYGVGSRSTSAHVNCELFAQHIRMYRAKHNITQGQLANFLGIKRPSLSLIEAGTVQPSIGLFLTLVYMIGTNAYDYLELSEEVWESTENPNFWKN